MTSSLPLPLFTPTQVGPVALSHRVVMAPLTRLRAGAGDVPGALMAEYYGQRASRGGLIVTEATTVSTTARGYLGAPGIYTDAQAAGWRKIVDVIHAKGGKVFLQLWHVGRVGHAELTGGAPVAPSEGPFEGVAFTSRGWVPVTPARALRTEEIAGIVGDFREGARRALAAGFDGVEIHSGNGYLLDQFLQDGSNRRVDQYGGSLENRTRLLLEVTEAVASVWGANRVAVRLTPSGAFNGMADSDPHTLFNYVAQRLNAYGLAYLHIIEPRVNGSTEVADGLEPVAAAELKTFFHGPIVAAGGFDPAGAEAIVKKGDVDLVAFGRHFISNPDLPKRIELGLPLNPYDRATFYGGTEKGYTDYPFYEQSAR